MVFKDAKVLCGDLNARRTSFFVQLAGNFRSNVWIEKEVRRVNAKSILDVLFLKIQENDEVRIIADGFDEVEAVETMVDFIKNSG